MFITIPNNNNNNNNNNNSNNNNIDGGKLELGAGTDKGVGIEMMVRMEAILCEAQAPSMP